MNDEVTYDPPDPEEDRPDPDERAVSLEYDEEEGDAPRVTAKGSGHLAEAIRDLAEEHNVPIYEDPDLLELLYELDLDEEIPAELYEVVAEVFAFVYRMNGEQSEPPRENR